jgi:hypothetical protein
LQFLGGLITLLIPMVLALPVFAEQVPVRDGQLVQLELRNVLTTDNVRKGDQIEFDVSEDVQVDGHVVITKGAAARGKVIAIKGAFRPKDKKAEVVFEFLTVRSVDRQDLPVRPRPLKSHKGKKDTEVHERSTIPGLMSRMVGAEKGKAYAVYINGAFTVMASDRIAAPAVALMAAGSAPSSPSPSPNEDLGLSSVEFRSSPDGADIVVNGKVVGKTPSTLRLSPGHHAIEIRMAGYYIWSRDMVVDPDSHPSVQATLIKKWWTISR